ncbi:MAG: HAD family hydrolase [Deltaproteobacteria bacterium]|nr:HAD family hydrolase [Deltaproteobacteria bacterium]
MTRKRRVAVFDIYNTLIRIKTDEDDTGAYAFLADWLSRKGISMGPQDLRARFKSITKKEIESSRKPHPEVEIGEVFEQVIFGNAAPGRARHRSLAVETALLFRMLTTKSISLVPGADAVLRELQNEFRLAIVSNSQRLFTMPELHKFDLSRYFEYMLFSSDIKTCKPDPAIFRKALADLRADPSDAVYVGDDPAIDVAGAKRAGMRAIWLNHDHAASARGPRGGAAPDAVVTVDAYRELPDRIREILGTGVQRCVSTRRMCAGSTAGSRRT